jgi:hypothetical protein
MTRPQWGDADKWRTARDWTFPRTGRGREPDVHRSSANCVAMQHQATLTYSQPLIRQAVWGFWRRVVGLRFAFALAFGAASLAFLLLDGDRSWLVGVIATALVLGILFIVALFFAHYRNSAYKLRAMDNGQAELTAAPSTLSFSSAAPNLLNSMGIGSRSLAIPNVLAVTVLKSTFRYTSTRGCFSRTPGVYS